MAGDQVSPCCKRMSWAEPRHGIHSESFGASKTSLAKRNVGVEKRNHRGVSAASRLAPCPDFLEGGDSATSDQGREGCLEKVLQQVDSSEAPDEIEGIVPGALGDAKPDCAFDARGRIRFLF